MRKLRRICTVCLALALVLMSIPPVEAKARYTYTIRIYAGQQGTIGGGEGYIGQKPDRVMFR